MKDQELKARWIAALRSGEFKQATQYLKVDGRYCCLGVLCHIAKPQIEAMGFQIVENGNLVNSGIEDGMRASSKAELIESLAEALDIAMAQDELVKRNDGRVGIAQHSFPEIADWIEANL